MSYFGKIIEMCLLRLVYLYKMCNSDVNLGRLSWEGFVAHGLFLFSAQGGSRRPLRTWSWEEKPSINIYGTH